MKFIFLFILLLSSCHSQTTIEKKIFTSDAKTITLFSPLPGELIEPGLIGISTSTQPFLLFINKSFYYCTESPCFVTIDGDKEFWNLEILDFRPNEGIPQQSANYTKIRIFTKNTNLSETINLASPSFLLVPVKIGSKYYLDYYIHGGKSNLENLTLKIHGDLSFSFKNLKNKLPEIKKLPITIYGELFHSNFPDPIEKVSITFDETQTLEIFPHSN